MNVEPARAEERHLVVEHVGDLDDLAGLDEPHRLFDGRGVLVIARAALVAGAPLRRTALFFRRHRPAWGLLSVGG
jgi:hypothetical protein